MLYLLLAVLVCGGVSAGAFPYLGYAAAAPMQGVWQNPEQVPGIAKLNLGRLSQLSTVSCSAPGECAGGGFYVDAASHFQAFVVAERKGVWGSAREVPGSATLNLGGNLVPDAISCASPGNCAVGGNYTDGSGSIQAWVADEVSGVWGDARELPGTAALNTGGNAMVTSISCAEPGYCAAGGSYSVAGTSGPVPGPFVASEVHGTWSPAIDVAGTGSSATLNSVSCASAGDCAAGGQTGAGAYIVTETSGTWGSAQLVAGTAALSGNSPEVTSISCESSGCGAVGMTGSFNGEGFGVTETGGTWGGAWGNAVALPLPVAIPSGDLGALQPQSLSCTSPRDCTAVGFYAISTSGLASVDQEGVTIDETNGTWEAPQTVPSLVALDISHTGSIPSVSCPAPGYCAAVGLYGGTNAESGAVLSETSGTWGAAQPLSSTPGETVGQSISCGAVAYCSVGGGFSADGQYYQAIVADETPVLSTTTIESLSAPRMSYGHEQAEKVTATVSARLGIATGKVAVMSDRKTACTITLAGGQGSCTIPAAYFSTGAHALTAMYGGATGFAASSSAARHVSVVKATSRTALTLSVARVRYGHEQAEKLTVKVIPQYMGTPGGTVAITVDRARVCVISLKRATGSCRLRARTLRAGTYQVRATYSGNPDFKASVSPKKPLTVRTRKIPPTR